MTDETEDEGIELEFVQPEPVYLGTPSGTFCIPDLDSLTAALGGEVLAYQATETGLWWLTPARRWDLVESKGNPASVRSVKPN
jgi:hypothetical protein